MHEAPAYLSHQVIDSDNSFDGVRSNTLSEDECTLERYVALERLQYSYVMSRKRLFAGHCQYLGR